MEPEAPQQTAICVLRAPPNGTGQLDASDKIPLLLLVVSHILPQYCIDQYESFKQHALAVVVQSLFALDCVCASVADGPSAAAASQQSLY